MSVTEIRSSREIKDQNKNFPAIPSPAPQPQENSTEDAVHISLSASPASFHASAIAQSVTNPAGRTKGFARDSAPPIPVTPVNANGQNESHVQGISQTGEEQRDASGRDFKDEGKGHHLDTQA